MSDMALLQEEKDNIVLFYPNIPEDTVSEVVDTLKSRWIGQGPKVDRFEKEFAAKFTPGWNSVAVNAGTSALHLSYIAAGIKPGDEVISPVFTCTATNIPLLHCGANIRFADIDPETLNISVESVKSIISDRTRAIVCVDYGGCLCHMAELRALADQYGIPVIEDAAQSLGGSYHGRPVGTLADYTAFSFQAIKHITTADGGMITLKSDEKEQLLKRLRWFGIDRFAKQNGIWQNDICEVGFKYQMTDISAAMGLAGLRSFDEKMALRQHYLAIYAERLSKVPGITVVGKEFIGKGHAAWLCTVLAENMEGLRAKLRENHIEANQVHFRNDRYSIFGGRVNYCPNMDAVEDHYLVLPLHTHLSEAQVMRVCEIIESGW
ncbi:MAG: DegT/DnrJ/EryC1/StrS family aminotransferase [Lentisphaeria bacterium]|nr:DegT/DnrJ/EryC1/StrS family aminotransferase [Lentisphaeria bacterium]